MKLKSLRLQNYRIHKESTLPLGDASFVVVRGQNMAGKTSFAEALSMNLANTTVSLAGDGKGFKAKISQSEKEATITAEIQGQHLLRNTMTLSVGAAGRTSEIECIDSPDDKDVVNRFKNFLTDRRAALLISLNTDYFGKLEEKAQADLLAKLVLPAHHKFPQDKKDAVEAMLGTGKIDFDANPFDVITKAYKALYDERKTVNVKVRDFVIPDALPMPKDVDSASLQTSLDQARKEKGRLQAERDQAVAKANEVEVKRGKIETNLTNLRAKVDEEKKKLTALESAILDAEALSRLAAVAGKKAELDQLNETRTAANTGINTLDAQITKFNKIAGQGANCSLCDQPIDSEKIAAMIASFQEEIAASKSSIVSIDEKIKALGDVAGALASIEKHNKAVKDKDELEASILETVKTGKATRAELDALGPKVDATAPFTQPLADVETKITSILEKLGPVAAAEQRAKDIKEKTDQLEKLQKKAAILDSLTKYFDTDGVKAELIKTHIGGFENKVNTVLDAFGYKTLINESLDFNLTTARGYVGPVKELSKAEKQLFYPAFQCAVSIAAGIGMVVIDDMDTYLKETGLRSGMYGSIFNLIKSGQLEQAIMIEASVDEAVPKPQAPGSRYFFITDGTVEELK